MGYRFALFIARPLDKGAGIAVRRLVALAIYWVVSGAVSNRYESEQDKRGSGDLLH